MAKGIAIAWLWLVVLLFYFSNYLLNARYVSILKSLLGL